MINYKEIGQHLNKYDTATGKQTEAKFVFVFLVLVGTKLPFRKV